MNGERLQSLFSRHDIHDMSLRAEVEQFDAMEIDDKLVTLYLTVRQKRGTLGYVANASYTTIWGALIAYKLFGGTWPL